MENEIILPIQLKEKSFEKNQDRHSFNKYLSRVYYLPDIVVDTGSTLMNKNPSCHRICILVG